MPRSKRSDSLEIKEDPEFQQKEWRFERAGWIGMVLVVLLALLGFFGAGPVSQVSRGEQDGFQVTYQRFGRSKSPTQMRIRLPAEAIQEGQASFWIDRDFIGKFQIENISPQPDSQELHPDRINFTFNIAGPSQPFDVKLDLTPEVIGPLQGRLGMEGGMQHTVSQFIYP